MLPSYRRRLVSALLLVDVSVAQLICDDGTTAGPVHLQFAQFLDVGAFPNTNVRVAYREDVLGVIPDLISTFGRATEYKLYYYNTPGPERELGCGYSPLGDGFLNAAEAEQKVTAELSRLGMDTLGPRDLAYSSLTHALYHSLRSEYAGWNKNERDENGVPILRIFSVGTDVNTFENITYNANQWTWDIGTRQLEDCINHEYPGAARHLEPAFDAFGNFGTYFLVLSDSYDTASWYSSLFYEWMGEAQVLSEVLGTDGRHKMQTLELAKKIACDHMPRLTSRPSITCSSTTTPVHLQLTFLIDVAAISDGGRRRAYRQDVLNVIKDVGILYGHHSEVQVYTYSTRPLCGNHTAAFSTPSRAASKLATEMIQSGQVKRQKSDENAEYQYSSLQDAMFHALGSPLWIPEAVDSEGLPVVRLIHFGTDVVAWVEGSSMYGGLRAPTVVDVLNHDSPEDYCMSVAYPTLSETLELSKKLPPMAYHGVILDRAQIEVPSTLAWYNETYRTGFSYSQWTMDSLYKSSDLTNLILEEIGKATCDAVAKIPGLPTAPPAERVGVAAKNL